MESDMREDQEKIRRYSLTFRDPSLEKGFAANKVEALIFALRWWFAAVLAVAVFTMTLLQGYWNVDQYRNREQFRISRYQLAYQCTFVGQMLVACLVVQVLGRYGTLSAFGMELMITCSVFVFLATSSFNMAHYFTAAFGHRDTEAFWGVEMGGTDASLLLGIDVCVTALHLMIPIRWKFLVPIQVIAIFGYMGPAFLFGSPDSRMVVGNCVGLVALVLMASLGKRRIERKERLEFLALLREKRKRFQAEFQLSQAPAAPNTTDVDDGASEAGPPSTTATGRVFNASASEGVSFDCIVALGKKEHWLIGEDEVQVTAELLGEGGFGVVARGLYQGAEVALKTPNRNKQENAMTEDSLIELCNELRVLRLMRHPRIVSLYGAVLHPSSASLCLVLEMIRGQPLGAFLQTHRSGGDLAVRVRLLVDIASALRYLHSRRPAVVHGDLKDNNIFVEQSHGGEFRSKLLDFGLSRQLTRHARRLGGTLRWVAPEVLAGAVAKNGKPNLSADTFSLGRLMFLFSTGQMPFADVDAKKLQSLIRRSPVLKWPEGRGGALAERVRPLAEQCMQQAAQLRPSILDVYSSLVGILHELQEKAACGHRSGESEGSVPWLSAFKDFMFEQVPIRPAAITMSVSSQSLSSVPEDQLVSTAIGSPSPVGSPSPSQQGASSVGSESRLLHHSFPVTPDHTMSMSMGLLLMQWNHELPMGSCCWMHAALKKAEAVLSDLRAQPCDGWKVPVDGQCPSCKLLRIEGGSRACSFCQNDIPE